MRNIVDKASKELSMEKKTLKEINKVWQEMELEHKDHSRTGLKLLKATEELIETLEDNQVQSNSDNKYLLGKQKLVLSKQGTSYPC